MKAPNAFSGKEIRKDDSTTSIYKRGSIYWYKFTFNGETIRKSTRQKNQHTARPMEAAHRASLAKGEGGHSRKEGDSDPEELLRGASGTLGEVHVRGGMLTAWAKSQ